MNKLERIKADKDGPDICVQGVLTGYEEHHDEGETIGESARRTDPTCWSERLELVEA